MSTLKLSNKPSTPTVSKAPARRAAPDKRDRSISAVAAQRALNPAPESPLARVPRSENTHKAPRKTPLANNAQHSTQRREDQTAQRRAPARDDHSRNDRQNSVPEPQTSNNRASNHHASENRRPAQGRPAHARRDFVEGVSPSPSVQASRSEHSIPQPVHLKEYRQEPRRGGKLRDGYDASNTPQYGAAARAAYKPTAVNTEQPRLSKVMAERGLCSRREADDWIVNGWVMVDGEILDTLGVRIRADAEIEISGYAYEQQAETVTIILHKPVGYVSGQAEDGYQPAIVLIHPDNQWADDPELHKSEPKEFQRGFLHGLAPAGRLDIDSTGMLVLTQDGRVARHLIGEDSDVEKEYLVRVRGELSEKGMQLLNHGLELDGVKLKPAKVSWQNEEQLRFALREGRKRQIRRMCEMVGLEVIGLKRTRIGSVNLGKLPVGEWRYLRWDEKF